MSDRAPPDPGQWAEAERWLARADEDIEAADVLVGLPEPMIGPAAFHCQQAAEKMVKAAIIALGAAPPRLHDIEALAARLTSLDRDFGQVFAALGGLTSWYVLARYPDAGLPTLPDATEIRQCLVRLREVRAEFDAYGNRTD